MDMGSTQANGKPNPEVPAKAKRRQHSAEFKRRILVAAEQVQANGGNVGAMLRKEGLYWAQLSAWRRAVDQGLTAQKPGRKPSASSSSKQEARRLARRVATLERELQQAQAIIEIQKKVGALLAMMPSTENDESSS
jgi:transposase-like protein